MTHLPAPPEESVAAPTIGSGREFARRFTAMVDNIGTVIKGKDDVIRQALVAMLAEGHVLFEDLPGTGKTVLARAIAATTSGSTSRVQCTPDLLPADITGSTVLDRATGDFTFREGPVFTNVLLADEVNRATPKTQSALLEAMAEKRVTFDGTTYDLPSPFFVIATMNPIELAGTFPLPEAQLDRFQFKLSLGYTDRDAEVSVLRANRQQAAILSLEPVVTIDEVIDMIVWARGVTTADPILYYITDLVQATRDDPALLMGASTRAAEALMRASRVMAASQGRDDVLPDDVKLIAGAVLNHRLVLTPDAQLQEERVDAVIDRILHRVKVPQGLEVTPA
ncbi:AAA family ATPase [Jiangella asiatica]|uniref:MoxR family ATPase n=1 Tax=Jiangella asiatica TaxID=2530372 RepID=A0A4V2Z2R7_9ACTN|nr:MoxR family ATPase [Jiangella asiatica]TDE09898.1 MoxR family ATPase [Jiangella asiatica]